MVKKEFYKNGSQDQCTITRRSYARTLEKMKSLLSLHEKDIILDFGCGNGSLTLPLQDYSNNVVGIDISLKNLREVKKVSRNVELVMADVEQLPFKNASFDAIFAFGVLEHLPSPSIALRDIQRCLKDKGKLLMFQTYRLDCYQIMWHRSLYFLRLIKEPISSVEKKHINQFKPEIWKTKIKNCGMTLNAVIPTSIIPTFPFYYIFFLISPKLFERYFNLPIIKNFDRILKNRRSISNKLAIANFFLSINYLS